MENPLIKASRFVKNKAEGFVYSTMRKFGYPSYEQSEYRVGNADEAPYHRRISPNYLERMAKSNSLINNSIEEKVSQTFRRSFTDWEKKYEAKCLECDKEFSSLDPFRDQLGDAGEEIKDSDIDFDSKRICPECGELSRMVTPDPGEKEYAEKFFSQCNERSEATRILDPGDTNSVGETFLEVCKEVAWDIQMYDDGWMLFEREYEIDNEGRIVGFDLKEVHRGPPGLLHYSVNEDDGKMGSEYWVCVPCRDSNPEDYQPAQESGECPDCGNKNLYEVYAYASSNIRGGEPQYYYIRGEFVHASEYKPSKFYGYSPILSLWEEARALEQMDKWYKEAYEQRRAPRGAMVIKSSNAESVKSWNIEQMEKLKQDSQHIPTFINDIDGEGKPIHWEPLLEEPAQMQHMQMREWFKERISAKYGVTDIFQSASPDNSGLSQSMEIIVSNRSAGRLRTIFNNTFVPALLSQLQIEGWEKEVARIEEEDEQSEAQLVQTELANAQQALQMGAEVNWTEGDRANIKPGELEMGDDEQAMGGMLGGMMGGGGDEPDNPTADEGMGGSPGNVDMGGAPETPDKPTTEEPIQASDDSFTTGDSGASNPSYSGGRGEVIDYLEHIEEQMNDSSQSLNKDMRRKARDVFDENFQNLGISSKTIKEYAEDSDKSYEEMKTENNGRWKVHDDVKDNTKKLYDILS